METPAGSGAMGGAAELMPSGDMGSGSCALAGPSALYAVCAGGAAREGPLQS